MTQGQRNMMKRFTRFTQPEKCRMCGKLTTWSDASGHTGLGLCRACFDVATMDNAHYDGDHAGRAEPGCRLCKADAPRAQEVK